MHCHMCKLYPELADTESFLFKGSSGGHDGYRIDTLRRHSRSKSHIACTNRFLVKKNPSNAPLAQVQKRMAKEKMEEFRNLFNMAYFVAKKGLAFSLYKDLCEIQMKANVRLGNNYQNTYGVKQFVDAIGETLHKPVVAEIEEARFISVMADGATDKGILEQELVFIGYVHSGKPMVRFLQSVSTSSANAIGITKCIDEALETVGVDLQSQGNKLVGICLDGAAVNMGKKNGVRAIFQDRVPHILPVHCVNHNMELAIVDTRNHLPYLQKFENTLKEIFKLYYYSPKRMRELENVANVIDEELRHFGGIQQVRWVASQSRALKALDANYLSTVTHLESIVELRDRDHARALGLLRTIKGAKFVKTLFVLQDILDPVRKLSEYFQKSDILIMDVLAKLETVMLALTEMKTVPGEELCFFCKTEYTVLCNAN